MQRWCAWWRYNPIVVKQTSRYTFFIIFPICPRISAWGLHGLSRLINIRVIYMGWELSTAGVHITFRCAGRFDVDLLLLMLGQTKFFYPFIYPGITFVYSSNEEGISNAYQVAKQTCLFKMFPFAGQSIRNSYFFLSATRESNLVCAPVSL